MSRQLGLIGTALLCLAFGPSHLFGQSKTSNPKGRVTEVLLHLLEEQIDTQEASSFFELLDSKRVPFYLDLKAFQDEASLAIFNGQVPPPKLPPHPRRMSVGAYLHMVLDQMEEGATFLIRKNRVEITSKKAACRANLLQQTFATAFDQHPLEFVLDDLSEMTGVTVIIDGRAKEKARAPVTARFRNDVPLLDALRMVTEAAELKLVVLPGGIFVTTATHADALQREQAAYPQRKDGNLQGVEP